MYDLFDDFMSLIPQRPLKDELDVAILWSVRVPENLKEEGSFGRGPPTIRDFVPNIPGRMILDNVEHWLSVESDFDINFTFLFHLHNPKALDLSTLPGASEILQAFEGFGTETRSLYPDANFEVMPLLQWFVNQSEAMKDPAVGWIFNGDILNLMNEAAFSRILLHAYPGDHERLLTLNADVGPEDVLKDIEDHRTNFKISAYDGRFNSNASNFEREFSRRFPDILPLEPQIDFLENWALYSDSSGQAFFELVLDEMRAPMEEYIGRAGTEHPIRNDSDFQARHFPRTKVPVRSIILDKMREVFAYDCLATGLLGPDSGPYGPHDHLFEDIERSYTCMWKEKSLDSFIEGSVRS